MRSSPAALALVLVYHCCVSATGGVTVRERWVDDTSRNQEEVVARAAALAERLVTPLRRLEDSLGEWEACVAAGRCSPEEFLRTIESALLAILNAPELAPLRDWVRAEFEAAKSEFAQEGRAGAYDRIQPAALRHPAPAVLLAQTRPGLFERVRRIVRKPREMAEAKALLADLCVTSDPPAAAFRMWPSSEPDRRSETLTTGQLVNVVRGLYAFQLTKGRATYACPAQRCAKLDLVNDPQPVFTCFLADTVCRRSQKPVEGCRARR